MSTAHPSCGFCGEPVEPGEQNPNIVSADLHDDCAIRMVIGSVAHLEKRCSCFIPDSDANDPPGMTLREAAHAAVALYRAKGRLE
jgi:hypothetical protein